MKVLFLSFMTVAMTLLNTSLVNASNLPQHITAKKVSTPNLFTISQDSIIDDIIFDEATYGSEINHWFTDSVWWQGSGTITVDLGATFVIQDVLIQVDYNDNYYIDYSKDELNWSNLFTIAPEDGEIEWGMDTMSSDKLHTEYVANMDFSDTEARYLRVSASGDDYLYYLSELQVFGIPIATTVQMQSRIVASPVPAPPSVLLFGLGMMMLMGRQFRRKKINHCNRACKGASATR